MEEHRTSADSGYAEVNHVTSNRIDESDQSECQNHTDTATVKINIMDGCNDHSESCQEKLDGSEKFNKSDEHDPNKDDSNSWSWVILFASFFNYMVVSAIWYSFSVLYRELAIVFDASLASIGVLASVEAAALHFTGAFCSGLVEAYGSRLIAMCGSLLAAMALFGGAFVNNLTSLYVVYGIAGSGIGLSYVSFVVIIQQYFTKRRTMASGFTLTGFSIASFLLPPLTHLILDHYGWRGTLMILAGIYLNGVVLAALLRPPPSVPDASKNAKETPQKTPKNKKLSRQISMEKTKSRLNDVRRFCRHVIDYEMFTYVNFVLYGVGTFLMMIGNVAFFMHLINRAIYLGIEQHQATFLPSIYGIANGVCRLLFSVVASLPKSNRILQYGLWIVAGGLISVLSAFATTFMGLAIVCAGFGMCVGAFICIQYPALVDLLGVEKIARSTGLLQLFIGAAGLIATPLGGWIYDVTENYAIPYFVLGSIMVLGGATVLVIPCLARCRCCEEHESSEESEQPTDNNSDILEEKQSSEQLKDRNFPTSTQSLTSNSILQEAC